MKKWFTILIMGLVGALVLGGAAVAEDPARPGEVRGTVVKLTEVVVNSQTRIPYADVSITLQNVDPISGNPIGPPVTHDLHAMWGGSGQHYGANAEVDPGTYDVTVDIEVPEFARSADDVGLDMSPISATVSGYVHH